MGNAKISSPDFNIMGAASLGIVEGHIVSIELLDGNMVNTNLKVIQYVNIQKNELAHLDKEVKHTDRFGQKLRCKVKFDKPGVFKFKVKLKPNPQNVSYSTTEKARNPNFKYSENEIEFVTNKNGEKIIESDRIFVSPAGGDKFEITAKDSFNTIKKTVEITNMRILYFLEIKMDSLTNITPNLNILKLTYQKQCIKLKGLTPLKLPYISNIDTNNNTYFEKLVNAKYMQSQGKQKDPYGIALVYTDQLAAQGEGVLSYQNAERINGTITIYTYDYKKKKYHYLWIDLDKRDWFVECYYIENGKPKYSKVLIPKTKCKVSRYPSTYTGKGMYNKIDIDVSGLPKGKKCEVFLRVKWVDRFRAGLSMVNNNITVVSTRYMWSLLIPYQEQQQIAIHEIGHQLGMVPNGSNGVGNKSKLDKPPLFYNRTHIGNHCNRPKNCVMYGISNNISYFCQDCAKLVKKLDLKNGVK